LPRFGFVHTFRIAIGTMLSIALLSMLVVIWSSQRSARLSERMNLAHQVYEGYLSLKANSYQLFKQYGDALIIGDRDRGAGEREFSSAVRADISLIRSLIAIEIDLVGSEEVEELETLAQIERRTNALIETLELYRTGNADDDLWDGWSTLSRVLDSDIDRDFRDLIDAALSEEAEEVAEARASIERNLRISRAAAIVVTVSALVAAALLLILVETRFRKPAQQLVAGAERFGSGDYRQRIDLSGSDELSQVARALDGMADRIEERTRAAADHRLDLERQVSERTTQLSDLLERAREAERRRQMMLSDVSHELKTPLTLIRGEADVALRAAAPDPAALGVALERIRDAASHTARIVDDLLFIARAEEERPRLSPQRTDLAELVRATAETFAWQVDLSLPQGPALADVDPDRLRQALLILLENARRHGGATVHVRLDPTPDGHRLTVEDDGPGMGEAEMAQAFERFYRGPGAGTSAPGGLGLGLPVARAIVQAHGGGIGLSNRSGGGLVAEILLPGRRLRAVS